MKNITGNLSIRWKFTISVLSIFIISSGIIFGYLIPSMKNSLIEAKKTRIKEIVVSSIGVLEYYNKLVTENKMDLDEAQQKAKEVIANMGYGENKNDYIWIHSVKMKMLSHPKIELFGNRDLSYYKDKGEKFIFSEMGKVIKKSGEGYVDYLWISKHDKNIIVPKISYVKLYKPWNWIVGTGLYTYEEKKSINKLYFHIGLAFLFTGFIIVISTIILSGQMVKPILNLKNGLNKISSGNLKQHIECNSHDEIGQLCSEFNEFVSRISDIIHHVKELSFTLTDSAEDLNNVSSLLSSSTNNIYSKAGEVATTTEQMDMNMNTVASTTEQMNMNISSVASSVEQMSQNMDNLRSTSDKLAEVMQTIAENAQKSSKVSQDAENTVNATHEGMELLKKSANEIGSVIDMIKRIAEKTNLLALNATIEAASAGEAGKGFGVVAIEIKELANQSALAAEDIFNKIEGIQKLTSVATKSINEMNDIVVKVNGITKEINTELQEHSKSIEGISINIGESHTGISSIARSAQELNVGSNDLARNITEAAGGVNIISENINGVHSELSENSKSAEKVNFASENLLQIAEKLKKSVSYFSTEKKLD